MTPDERRVFETVDAILRRGRTHRCRCPICQVLDSDPTIVTGVYDDLVRITWPK